MVKTFESCAEFDQLDTDQGLVDRGGSINLLINARAQVAGTDASAPISCLVRIERWSAPSDIRRVSHA